MALQVDVLIVGAGIAGSALAFELAADRTVAMVEREAAPGYHSTGRSAAMLTETYGTAAVRALAAASRAFFERPPPGFCAYPLLAPRGMLHVARADQAAAFEQARRDAAGAGVRLLGREAVLALAPFLDPAYAHAGLYEAAAMAIDVSALHQGYVRAFRERDGHLACDADILSIARRQGGWEIETRAGALRAGVLVNAAGAWADEIAEMAGVAPLGLVPRRRTALLLDPPDGMDPTAWPMVIDVEERFYVKPEAGQLLVSPADATPVAPSDVQPEELDVALAVDHFECVSGRKVVRIGRRWAGLRTFAPDENPVLGPDPGEPAFFWLAGQGGFGIMTAPAMAQAAAALLRDGAWATHPGAIADAILPHRLRTKATVQLNPA
jgi:D-arginine dehydrogenase